MRARRSARERIHDDIDFEVGLFFDRVDATNAAANETTLTPVLEPPRDWAAIDKRRTRNRKIVRGVVCGMLAMMSLGIVKATLMELEDRDAMMRARAQVAQAPVTPPSPPPPPVETVEPPKIEPKPQPLEEPRASAVVRRAVAEEIDLSATLVDLSPSEQASLQ